MLGDPVLLIPSSLIEIMATGSVIVFGQFSRVDEGLNNLNG
jgi:hypothetical protein